MRNRDLPLLHPSDTLLRGLAVIDAAGIEAALVVEDDRLVGILTDGDARRAILRGHPLDGPVAPAMQRRFTSVGPGARRVEVLDLMKARVFKHLPVVDAGGRLVGLHLLRDLLGYAERPNAALILCGGLGTRLRPVTEQVPKPMLCVAGRPILEHAVLHLVGYGFRRIFLATHYRHDMIEGHFGDGARFGCEIQYIQEARPLGTGGAFALLPPGLEHPVLVMNGDLVTQFDAAEMLDAHARGQHRATIGATVYTHDVPFGVLEAEGGRLLAFREKPSLRFQVNGGIYLLDADLRFRLPAGEPATVPGILEDCLARGERVGIYHLDPEWTDVGSHQELRRARGLA